MRKFIQTAAFTLMAALVFNVASAAGTDPGKVSPSRVYSVTFDNITGTGFVGKGDVQLAFGWNNAQLQSNASGVTFTYNATDTYDAECYWETTTGNGRTIIRDITVPKHVSVNSTVGYEARKNSQQNITGFNLNGFGTVVTDGTVPAVGDACPGNNSGTITAVTLTGSTGGLSVNSGGISVALPNTPIL